LVRSGSIIELRTGDTSATEVLDTITGSFSGFGGLSINESGHALASQYAPSTRKLVFYHDGVKTTLVDEVAPFSQIGNVSLNDHDDVAFYGEIANTTTSGIYFGPDPATQRLIQSGDTLFGATVGRIQGFTEGCLNNSGQILFSAQFPGGTTALVLATPVPEPGTLTLVCIPLLARRRRRSRGCSNA
jgi:hypothetical protein